MVCRPPYTQEFFLPVWLFTLLNGVGVLFIFFLELLQSTSMQVLFEWSLKFEPTKPDAPDVEVLWTGLVLHKDVVAHVRVSDIHYGDNILCTREGGGPVPKHNQSLPGVFQCKISCLMPMMWSTSSCLMSERTSTRNDNPPLNRPYKNPCDFKS